MLELISGSDELRSGKNDALFFYISYERITNQIIKTGKNMIQVLNRAFDILELLGAKKGETLSLSEVSDSLNLNHSTCANIIKTMINRGYIEKTGRKGGGYRLGSRINYLSGHYPLKEELLRVSVGLMKDLTSKLNEGSILALIQDNYRILLHEEKSTHELQVVNHKVKEVYKTSTGRLILACKTRTEQEAYIKKYGLPDEDDWPEIMDEDDFFNELQKIRKRKIAIHIAKSNIVGIAVPVFINGTIEASLGVYLPEARFTPEMKKKIFRELNNTAGAITKMLKMKE